jgi:hypothetical protein
MSRTATVGHPPRAGAGRAKLELSDPSTDQEVALELIPPDMRADGELPRHPVG